MYQYSIHRGVLMAEEIYTEDNDGDPLSPKQVRMMLEFCDGNQAIRLTFSPRTVEPLLKVTDEVVIEFEDVTPKFIERYLQILQQKDAQNGN